MLTVVPVSGLAAQNDAASYVNTLIGTQRSAIGYGGTMPFVTTPFGMTSWTPQTRQNKISVTSYNYDDTTISGFIGTHQPAIWMGDYGYVTVIPQVGELRTTPESRKLPYSHDSEKARPDYYGVSLDAGALRGCEVFYGYGDADDVMPRALVNRSRAYLSAESGAHVEIHGYRAGHGIPPAEERDLARWYAART